MFLNYSMFTYAICIADSILSAIQIPFERQTIRRSDRSSLYFKTWIPYKLVQWSGTILPQTRVLEGRSRIELGYSQPWVITKKAFINYVRNVVTQNKGDTKTDILLWVGKGVRKGLKQRDTIDEWSLTENDIKSVDLVQGLVHIGALSGVGLNNGADRKLQSSFHCHFNLSILVRNVRGFQNLDGVLKMKELWESLWCWHCVGVLLLEVWFSSGKY